MQMFFVSHVEKVHLFYFYSLSSMSYSVLKLRQSFTKIILIAKEVS